MRLDHTFTVPVPVPDAWAVLLDEENPDKPWGGLPQPALVVTHLSDRSADVMAERH